MSLALNKLLILIVFSALVVALLLLSSCSSDSGSTPPPAAQTIIYQLSVNNQLDLYAIKEDGSNLVELSADPTKTDDFETMSADNMIIFSRYERDSNSNRINNDIYVVNPDGSNLTPLANTIEEETFLALTVSGRIVYSVAGNLYSMASNGSDLQQLTTSTVFYLTITVENNVLYQIGQITYIIPADNSTAPVQLSTAMGDKWLSLTPDGRLIFQGGDFSSAAGTLYIVNQDGTNMNIVTPNPGYNYYNATTSAGRIIYSEDVNFYDWDIYSVNTDGSNHQPLATTVGTSEQFNALASDNSVIYEANNHLFSINANATGSLVQLDNSTTRVQVQKVSDSNQIFYTQDEDATSQFYDLYMVDTNGSNRVPLAVEPGSWQGLAGIISNNRIIYSSSADKGATQGDIYLVDTSGNNRVTLAADPNLGEWYWKISTRDRAIYTANDGTNTELYSVELNGNGRQQITSTGGNKSPVYLY